MLFRFHAAGPSHHHKVPASNFDSVDVDNRFLGLGLSADQLIPFLHGQDPFDLRKGGQGLQGMMGALVTDGSDDCLKFSIDWVGSIT